jgi:hypothetical protein
MSSVSCLVCKSIGEGAGRAESDPQTLSELGVFFFWLGKAFITSLQPPAAADAASASFCTLNKWQS